MERRYERAAMDLDLGRKKIKRRGQFSLALTAGLKHGAKQTRMTRSYNINSTAAKISLPYEILVDILSRLPVCSIARFRSVCKQWCFLTYEPYFVREQHERATKRIPGIICCLVRGKITSYNINIEDDVKESSFTCDFSKQANFRFSNFVDGLACAYSATTKGCNYYLVNPSIQEYAMITTNICRDGEEENIGLGFDVYTGKFKLVRIVYYQNSCRCDVLTLGTNEWRHTGETPCWVAFTRPVFFRGSLYWKGGSKGTGLDILTKVLVLDLKTEMFRVVVPPQTIPRINCYGDVGINELRGHICLTIRQHSTRMTWIWMLKDDGEWFEMCSISRRDSTPSSRKALLQPEVIGGAGEAILFEETYAGYSEKGILSYQLNSKTFRKMYDRAMPCLLVYWESLVSPRKLITGLDA